VKFLNSKSIFILSFIFLFVLVTYGLGMVTVRKNWLVWQKTKEMSDVVKSLYRTGQELPNASYFPRPNGVADQRYVVSDAAAVSPGWVAVTRLDASQPRYLVDLLDPTGKVTFSWPIDYPKLVPGGEPMEFPHATKVMPDGTLLVSFDDGQAMGRLDACGNPMWVRSDQTYHHVFQKDEEGFWTWRALADTRGDDQKLYRFDAATGKGLESIDLIDDVVAASARDALIASIPKGYEFTRETWNWNMPDLFHPNDIEPLTAEMADAFPQFSPGDLLISLRNINLVAVIDRQTNEFLWASRGPWREQHDPDWQADGTITVFNNNLGRGRSSIVKIDPQTNAASVLFGGDGPKFYSSIMGNHERLPNGNWLILSTTEGRLIEVTATGAPVREYNNMVNARYNAIMPNVEYLAPDHFEQMPECNS
jgi:Arylsulfotransferase (ASST)